MIFAIGLLNPKKIILLLGLQSQQLLPRLAVLLKHDAAGKLLHLCFCEAETTFDYMLSTRAYIEQYGKPLAFYSDKHSVFRVNQKSRKDSQITQFGRILNELNIDIIFANSPQAKGRVERANRTLQNRLIKEIRLGRHQFDCRSECLANLLH